MCRGIVYAVYLLDVLVESHSAQLLLDYYCARIDVRVLRGGGGGMDTTNVGGGDIVVIGGALRPTWGSRQNYTLLPLTMTRDR